MHAFPSLSPSNLVWPCPSFGMLGEVNIRRAISTKANMMMSLVGTKETLSPPAPLNSSCATESLQLVSSRLPLDKGIERHVRSLSHCPPSSPIVLFKRTIYTSALGTNSHFLLSRQKKMAYHYSWKTVPWLSHHQKRTFFGRFFRDPIQLELAANENPSDPKMQAAFYRHILHSDPDVIVKRFEDDRYARNAECVELYLCVLYESGQLDRAAKFFTLKANQSAVAANTLPSSPAPALSTMAGTKERPIYVYNTSQGNGWRRVSLLINVVIVGGILWSLANFNEQRLGGITTRVHKLFSKENEGTTYSFDDVQGCDEAKHELEEVVEFLKNPTKFNKLGAKMPKGVLLIGPPGTGKTLLAKAVAGEADVPFIYASGSSFEEIFVGVGSARIRQMFESAKEQAPCIIFIDELDAIGSRRNPRDPQHSRMSLNQLLTEMDGFSETTGIVVIAATNIPEALDKALLRPGRFDKHVDVPLPDKRGRMQILERYLRNVPVSPDVDIDVVARVTPGFSGADLAKIANQAKIKASVENIKQVTMYHLERSIDEMILGTERKNMVLLEEDRRLTAYHEGGHAIVALYTPSATPIHKATIIPRGKTLGMVAQLPERDELSLSKAQLLARMDVAMGGRVAEELLFGANSVTTGASTDFLQATAIARAMVTQYGMSEKVGPIAVEDLDALSPQFRNLIDAEIQTMLEQSRQRAMKIIREHQNDLERLSAALLEYETLTREEIIEAIKGKAGTGFEQLRHGVTLIV